MALQKANFFLSLAQGISTKEDEKQVVPGKLLELENGVFISPKEIKKRYGNVALSSKIENSQELTFKNTVGENVTSGNFITNFTNEIILNDNFNLYSYSQGLDSWIYKNKNTISGLEVSPILRDTNSQFIPDSAYNPTGLQMFAWEDDSDDNSRLSIVDNETGQIIISSQLISPTGAGKTVKPKCIYINGFLTVFWLDNSVNMTMYYMKYKDGVFNSPVVFASDINVTNNNYDVLVSDNKIYITYNSTGNSIKTTYLTSQFSPSAIDTLVGVNANNCVTLFSDNFNSNVWLAYSNSTNTSMMVYNNTLDNIVLSPVEISVFTDIYNITGAVYEGEVSVFYDRLGSVDVNGKYSDATIYVTNGTLTGSTYVEATRQDFLKSVALHSKAFNIEFDDVYIPHVTVIHDAYLQPTYFLCNLYNNIPSNITFSVANVVSKIAHSVAGSVPSKKSSLSAVNILDSGLYQTPILQKDLLFTLSTPNTNSGTSTYSQTGIMSAEFNFAKTNPITANLGQNLHIGAGILSMYDGATVVEHNFHLYPENISATQSTTGGSIAPGTYGFQVTYEWSDNQGQLHRSAPSPVLSVVVPSGTSTNSIELTLPTLRITAKKNVNIVVYRTAANGTVYYRLNSPLNPITNLIGFNSVTYLDTASDASILANQQLYTTGGEVVNSAAPATKFVGEFKNRLILIPDDNSSSYWYSKEVIPGSPVEFSNRFVENIGTTGGPVTAFMQMDGNGILFKENTISYISGDGPSPAGTDNNFTQAANIPSDVGCINNQSLVLMPIGIMFKSHKGIYLLSRDLSVSYIGADVEKFNEFDVTSAELIAYTNQVRFTLSNKTILVYDYFVNQWSTFTSLDAVSSVVIDNVFTYLQPNGLALQENQNTFTDNGAAIKLKIVTSWLSLAGLQGFQRIYKALILGKYYGTHKLQIEIAYDFNPINTQRTYFDVTKELNSNIYGQDLTYGLNSPYGGNYPTYQWSVSTQKQTCEAIQFTISDVPQSGPYVNNQGNTKIAQFNESLSLSAITLECGVKRGTNKLKPSRTGG